MSKLTQAQQIAKHVKDFKDNTADHQNNTAYLVGKDIQIQKDDYGNISVYCGDARILLMETAGDELDNGMTAYNAIQTKYLNAIKDALGWEFTLVWAARKLLAYNSFGSTIPLAKREYSKYELERIAYS